jgi:hypothetical protein
VITKNKRLRKKFKEIYKVKKAEDGKTVGRVINDNMQLLFDELRLPAETMDTQKLENLKDNLTSLRKTKRFRDDFPSFSSFYRYVTNKDNGFAVSDVLDL